ncbi:MAG: nucleoside-triphosphatase [Bacteroidota bacterium]|nr:nucleoside-triphosphatase [Bacteroidota bacterium]
MNKRPMINQRWQKAALLGSVWASLEIVVGSFLHNLKFPLTGTILSAVGISLLIAGHSLWKEKGIVWRAGLICAVMKSVSPSSVILGPMIGIAAEAFIVETAIRLLGGNAFGYIVGGAVACTTPLIQKTISYLFTYGMNIAVLFEKLVEFASKSLQISTLSSVDVIVGIIVINLFGGSIAAITGMRVGIRAAIYAETRPNNISKLSHQFNKREVAGFHFSALLLATHFFVLVGGLIVQSFYLLLYIPFCFYRYQKVRQKFQRWMFWGEIGIVSIFAGFVLGELTLVDRTSGIIIGLQMFFRAIFVISIFTAVSVELRNPVVVNFLFKQRMKNFSLALDLAFGALPSIIDSLQQEKTFFRHPVDSLSRILARTNEIQIPTSKVFVLSGEKGSGKTTILQDLLPELKMKKIATCGILQIGLWKNNVRYGYDLLSIESGSIIPLCRIDAPDTGISTGPFKFFPEAIQFGRNALSISTIGKCDVAIMDEIGPLELSGSGWADPLDDILQNYSGTIIIVIRNSHINEIIKKFALTPIAIWNSQDITTHNIVDQISAIQTK